MSMIYIYFLFKKKVLGFENIKVFLKFCFEQTGTSIKVFYNLYMHVLMKFHIVGT
jgi:hypothetical protein